MSTIYNIQDMEVTWISINGEMYEEDEVCLCNELLLSHKKEQNNAFAATWMDLEIIILSEVSQRKTNAVWYQLYRPTEQEHSLFSIPSPAFIVCRLFDEGHSDQCEVTFHCGFDLLFSNNERCWASFHVFVSHLSIFFEEMSV